MRREPNRACGSGDAIRSDSRMTSRVDFDNFAIAMSMRSELPSIFAFSNTDWRGIWMNRQHLLSRLARRGWPVVYSIGVMNIWKRESSAWRNAPLFARTETEDGILLDLPGRIPFIWPKLQGYRRWVMRQHMARLARKAH